jgi:YVTN family beta-propeller protein
MATRLFTTDTDSGTISVLDANDGAPKVISVIPVGNGPRGAVKFTTTGKGYVSNSAGDTISEIDAISMRETARIKVGIAPMGVGIIPGDRYALVSNSGSNYISVVDLAQRKEIHQIATGREPRHMAVTPDGNAAYVAISGADYVAKIETSSLVGNDVDRIRSEVREVLRIAVAPRAMPYSVAIDPAGKLAVAVNNQGQFVTFIDLKSGSPIGDVDVGHKGGRGAVFTPDGKRVFVSIEDTNSIIAIDVASLKILNTFESGPGPRGMALDANKLVLYASCFSRSGARGLFKSANSISIVDLSASPLNLLEKAQPKYSEISVGAGPCSISIFEV